MRRLRGFILTLLDPRIYLHGLRILHFYNYSFLQERRRLTVGRRFAAAPNVSLRNAHRIRIGDDCHLGERCSLWAGDARGRITIGDNCIFGPAVYVTASNYTLSDRATPMRDLPRDEADVTIGSNTWCGYGATILPGVTIGDGAVVAAGAVVTADVEPWSIVGGVPARIIGRR